LSPETIREFIILVVLIMADGFFAASEMAVVSLNKIRLHQLVDEGRKKARIVERLATDSGRFLATIQVGMTLVGFLAAATAASSLTQDAAGLFAEIPIPFIRNSAHGIALVLITVLLALIMLLLGELVPKRVAIKHAERIAFAVARPVDVLTCIFSPVVRTLVFLSNKIAGLLGAEPLSGMPFVTQDEIRAIVDAGEEGGVLEEDEKEMIFSIFDFGETLAREVMVPRIDVIAVEADTPMLDALDVIVEEGFSRIPVYERTIDNIIGLLYAKDLLVYLKTGNHDVDLRSILRPAYFVPETKKVDDLLKELQQSRVHMAIIVDEYGGTAGIVTIEDLIEEIVGEIQDEYDSEEPSVEQVGEGEFIFDARVPLDDVNQQMGVDLPSSGGDTLGGFIYSQLGRVAAVGDEVEFGDLFLTVLSVMGRRIHKVRVLKVDRSPEQSAPQEGDTTRQSGDE